MGATVSAAARAGGVLLADNAGCSPCFGTEAVVREAAKEESATPDEIYRRSIKWSGKGRPSVDNIPYVPVACGPMGCCSSYMPFLPQNVLPPAVWEPLKRECWTRGIGERDLQNMFLQLCDPGDTSWGTVRIIPFLKTVDVRARRTARRLLRAEAGLRSRRMRFEDLARCVIDICMLDFAGLVIASARSLHRYHALDIVTVRAIVRFAANDDVDLLTRAILRTAYPPDGTDKHTSAALVQFALRYPTTVLPFLEMQTAFQRRFPSLQFWREHHQRRGTLLLPVVLTPDLARAITSRVLILECLSDMATPFLFGAPATAVRETAGVLVSAGATLVATPWLDPPRYRVPTDRHKAKEEEGEEEEGDEGEEEDDGTDETGSMMAAYVPMGSATSPSGAKAAAVAAAAAATSTAAGPPSLPSTMRGRVVVTTSAGGAIGPGEGGEPSMASTTSINTPSTTTGRSFFPTSGRPKSDAPQSQEDGRSSGRGWTMTGRSSGPLFEKGTTRSDEARQWLTDRSIDVSLKPVPPPKTCEWVKKVPPPHGSIPQLTSVQIAERVYLHVASGAGASYDFVSAPCLLCGRNVAHVREEGRKRRLAEAAEAAAAAAESSGGALLSLQRRRTNSASSAGSYGSAAANSVAPATFTAATPAPPPTILRKSTSRRNLEIASRTVSKASGSQQQGGQEEDEDGVGGGKKQKKTRQVAKWKVSAKEARKRQRLALRRIKSVQKAIRGMHALNTEDTLPDDGLALFEAPAGTNAPLLDGATVHGVSELSAAQPTAAVLGDLHDDMDTVSSSGSSSEDSAEHRDKVDGADANAADLAARKSAMVVAARARSLSGNRLRTVSFRGDDEEKEDEEDRGAAVGTVVAAGTAAQSAQLAQSPKGANSTPGPMLRKHSSPPSRRPHTADSPSRSQRSLQSIGSDGDEGKEGGSPLEEDRPKSADDVSGRTSRSSSHRNLPVWTPYNEEPNPNLFVRLASPDAKPGALARTLSGSLATARVLGPDGSVVDAAAGEQGGAGLGGASGAGGASGGAGAGAKKKARNLATIVNEDGEARSERFTKGNNGFCDECDVYIHKALVDSFGYKMAATIHKATAVPPPVERELALRMALARIERRPLRGLVTVPGGPIGARDRPQDFVFDDDIFLEMFDDATEDFFYYNVATGKAQWTRPAKYVPYTASAVDG